MSSVEGYLTRELGIRFIDARELANEAKIALGISGYPSQNEHVIVRKQARRIFESLSKSEQEKLKVMNCTLTAIKSLQSRSSHIGSDTDSEAGASHSRRKSGSRRRGWMKRTFTADL